MTLPLLLLAVQVCADSPEQAQKTIEAISRTMPSGGRHVIKFAPILCGAKQGCCAAISATPAPRHLSVNPRMWHDLALGARMTVFAHKSNVPFCAKITAAGGEVIAVPDLTSQPMQRLQILIDKMGINRAAEYLSYQPMVDRSMTGQTLIPCGTPESLCSCSGEIEVHVWEDDPQEPQTLAHEATHAWLYYRGFSFSHCSGRVPSAGCQTVNHITVEAEREAQVNARDPH